MQIERRDRSSVLLTRRPAPPTGSAVSPTNEDHRPVLHVCQVQHACREGGGGGGDSSLSVVPEGGGL